MKKIEKIAKDLARKQKQPVYIIAEMACAHNGKYELAKRIVDAVCEAGADAIQFQIFVPEAYICPSDPNYEFIKKISLSIDEWIKLFEQARKNNLEVLVTANDRKAIDIAESEDAAGYKVHSADLNNPYLLDYLAPLGRPIRLCVGGSFWNEIENAIANIFKHKNKNIVVMYGMQNFPTPIEQINLYSIAELKARLGLPVGYEDHTDGDSPWSIWLPIMALGLGVKVLEKHITYDRSKKGIDYQSALNPDEFCKFVKSVRTAENIFGQANIDYFLNLNEEAMKYRAYAKVRSVVTAKEIKAGESIDAKDIMVLRYREGKILPQAIASLIGRKVSRDLPKLYPMAWDDLVKEEK